jgi:y4mF family transcriptional regulator
MRILDMQSLGKIVRARRKELGYTQAQLAERCGCGVRYLSELENGKPTIEMGKALHVIHVLGLDLFVEGRQ